MRCDECRHWTSNGTPFGGTCEYPLPVLPAIVELDRLNRPCSRDWLEKRGVTCEVFEARAAGQENHE